ncbi:MAG: hypothetical protein EB078_00770 [Proteobacteria bacterium]|nr:hypothetical protein [Pseudomonadota bacterium]NDC23917.1 hypothetical protein [Pseudomonadota bacterium]NDD03410.1 hypothetical protein [Pseudomonadota bacterium]NDG25766.1 hypothetical protein [Pseudomonadota bacterium]
MKTFRLVILFFSFPLFADYAWLPSQENLIIKTGWEIFKTHENFDAFNERRDLITGSVPSSLVQNKFTLDLEYGLSEQWATYMRTGLLSAVISQNSSGSGLLSTSGLFDTSFGFKWRTASAKPVIALEGGIIIPPYSVEQDLPEKLAIGDGVAGALLRLHAGTKVKRFVFSVSPGLVFRFGGFANQALIEAACSVVFKDFFVRLFQSTQLSLNKETTQNPFLNSEVGSGGSFSRLSTQPDLLSLGLRIGARLSPKFRTEAFFSQTLWGSEAANGFSFGLSLVTLLDFFVPDTREKIKEVPFNSEQEPEKDSDL